MTNDRDLDRLLGHWLADDPTVAPDRVLDVVADRISAQRQRPVWRLPDWRSSTMSRPVQVIALAAVLLTIVASAVLLGPGSSPPTPPNPSASLSPAPTLGAIPTGVPSPTLASPSASIVASPTATSIECRSPQAPACRGLLPPGAHRSNGFVRPFGFTVPADWYNLDAVNTQYQLHRYGDPANQQIIVYFKPEMASQAAGCPPEPEPGRSGTVVDWIDFLTTHPGLAATEPQTVSVGALTGTLIDIRIADGWSRPCPWSRDAPYVNFLTGIYWPFEGWGRGGDARARLVFVEPPQGGTVLIEVDANSGGAFDGFIAAAMPIVESITFDE